MASAQLTSFFGALESVLRYRATVLQAFRHMGRFTVNATVLSTRDVLVLLHKWSLIERDVRLQEALRAALEKHPVRELLSECPPFPSRSVPQSSQGLSRSQQRFRRGRGLATGPVVMALKGELGGPGSELSSASAGSSPVTQQ